MKKLKERWNITSNWQIAAILLVFSFTGSASIFVGKPIIKFLGISKENLNPILYWVLYILLAFIFYQILLVAIGWLFGQYKFFWEFEKKMLRRLGFKRFLKDAD
jgi:hypothetical protein